MALDTTYRTNQSEIMDDFDMKGDVLKDALDKIAKINQLLGGNSLTLHGVEKLMKQHPAHKKIRIIDIGCGNGDMLRIIANHLEDKGIMCALVGIDANKFTINYARKLSHHYPNIKYKCEDIFNIESDKFECDIVLCTLTMHHFKDDEIVKLLEVFKENAKLGIVINDLQRSSISYRLFQLLCFVFRLNAMSRDDGLVSILRGFKKRELVAFSKKLKFKKYTIQWKWAFRYQWIINTN